MNYVKSVELARALHVYNNRSSSSTRIDTVLSTVGFRKGSFDSIFPTMFSIHNDDIVKIATSSKFTKTEGNLILKAYKLLIKDLNSSYTPITEIEISDIISKLDEFVSIFNNNINAGTISIATMKKLQEIEGKIRNIFGAARVVYYIPSDDNSIGSIKLTSYSFKNLRDTINKKLSKYIDIVSSTTEENTSKLETLSSTLTNYGHTLVEGESGSQILTSKLLNTLLSIKDGLTEDKAKLIATDFIEYTGQHKTKITVHQGVDTRGRAVFNLLINSGYFQSTIVQDIEENQNELGKAEQRWKITDRSDLVKALGFNSVAALVNNLIKVKASPSLIDKIGMSILSGIDGKRRQEAGITTKVLLDESIKIPKLKIVAKVNKGTKLKNSIRTPKGQFQSPIKLEALLRISLAAQIEKNMGKGSSHNVLNYRTGRFANSASIERVTTTRDGAISVFYNYMKNPYATFSEGGAQQWPKTRDPKLLISKSIREIGASLVSNRMRAILV